MQQNKSDCFSEHKLCLYLVTFVRYSVWNNGVPLKPGLQVIQCHSSSSRMRVIMNHNWSATKQRLHPQSVAEICRHSVLLGDRIRQCETSSVWLTDRSVSVSRHFLLQAPQCPCFVRKRFNRDHCCRGRLPDCEVTRVIENGIKEYCDFEMC